MRSQMSRPDMDEGDASVSESSWADAQADTPTMGNGRSDSEDTLSNLSLDNEIGLDSPGSAVGNMVESTDPDKRGEKAGGEEFKFSDSHNQAPGAVVKLRLNDFDVNDDMLSLPPGVDYRPPSVDFPTSPSQLKISQGPSFMPKEDLNSGVASEDESSVNSYRAHLNLNGDVRITKRDEPLKRDLRPQSYENQPDSLQIETGDDFEDYHEDFFNPLSNELVMQRATSFRRKVHQQFQEAVYDKAMKEIGALDTMLSSFDDAGEEGEAVQPSTEHNENMKQQKSGTRISDSEISPFNESSGSKLSAISRDSVRAFDVISSNSSSSKSGITNGSSGGSAKGIVEFDHNVSMDFEQLIKRKTSDGAKPQRLSERKPKLVRQLFPEEESLNGEPESMLDIDKIVREHAPNLMQNVEPLSFHIPQAGEEEASNYFLPKNTVEKITSVFESSNFNNIYTLSGELKHILTPLEIEEIIANKDQLATQLNPNIFAALSWSLNPISLPDAVDSDIGKGDGSEGSSHIPNGTLEKNYRNVANNSSHDELNEENMLDDVIMKDDGRNCFSSATSLSNGFHSKESSMTDISDQNELDEPLDKRKSSNMVPVKDEYSVEQGTNFQRGGVMTASMRRKISLGKSLRVDDIPEKYVEDDSEVFSTPQGTTPKDQVWESVESLDDLGVVDDSESKNGSDDGEDDTPKMVFVRRDSKRFNKGMNNRVVQGLFLESKHSNGTLKRLKVPKNIEDLIDVNGEADKSLEEDSSLVTEQKTETKPEAKSPKKSKKRISVDDKILSIASELDDSCATEATQSDVFHSFVTTAKDEDRTIKSDDGDEEDITLDLDTPDDMEGSILEQLESLSSPTGFREHIPDLPVDDDMVDENRWKSFRVGASDINIDLQAIQPYRRVLSHGGYFDAEQKCAIILFSGCYLPDRDRKEYTYLMDHLFLYVLSTLEELIVDDYILVYLHGATPPTCMPKFSWLKRCYQLVDHRLRKNLKGLYLVHPTLWLKAIVTVTKPFVSKKLQFVNTLSDLCLKIPTEHLVIPDQVLQYDFELKLTDLKRQNKLS